MPTVPVAPRVNPGALPGVRVGVSAPPAAFGGVSPGLDVNGPRELAARIGQEEKVKADQVALTDAGAQLSAAKTGVLSGPNGVLNRRSKDAFSAGSDAESAWQAATQSVRANLGNDDQRLAFDRMAANEWSQANEQIQRHVAQQRQAYDTDTTDAFVANKGQEALVGYQDPAIASAAIEAQRGAVTDYGKRNGWSDEQIAEQVGKTVSASHYGIFERLQNEEQDMAATAYFQQHRSEFVGKDLQQAEKLADLGSVRAESQRQADAISASATSLTDAVAQTQQITDPRVRDAAETRVRRHFADKAADEHQAREDAFTQASAMLEQSKDASTIPISLRTKMSPEQNDALDRREQQLRYPKVETNVSLYAHLINMAGLNDATRAQFLATDLTSAQYRSSLSNEDYKQVLNLQRTMRTGEDRTSTRADDTIKRREETTVLKQTDAAQKQTASRAQLEKMAPGSGKYVAPPAKVVVPQWMVDSARATPEYADYLKLHGIKVDPLAPAPGAAPTQPRVPGAPLIGAPAPTVAPTATPPAPTPTPAPRRVTIVRDKSGRATALIQDQDAAASATEPAKPTPLAPGKRRPAPRQAGTARPSGVGSFPNPFQP